MGYDLNRFISSIDPFLFCPLCNRVLKNPILFDCPIRNDLTLENSNSLLNSKSYFNQTHIFCKSCFEKFDSNENLKCPIDGKKIKKNLRKDIIKNPPAWITEQLSRLIISCDNFGCKANLTIPELELHRTMCEYNPHRATTPSLHMLDTNSHFSPYHPHRPSSIATPGPSIMNQMHAAAAASNQHPSANLHSSAASANIHHHPQASTWYNDFDNWSMYEHHHSMVNPISNQSSQVSQPIIPTPSLTQSSHNVHHSISAVHQQHHLSTNGPMFNSHSQLSSPSQQSSINSISNKQQYSATGLNQASLSSLHSSPLSVSITQQHNQSSQSLSGLSSLSSTPSAQQNHFANSTHSSQLPNQQYQSQQNHFSHQQSSFLNSQKQNSSVQSLPLNSSTQRNSTTSKQSLTMPPPPPSPSTQFSQNSSLISSINHNSKNIDLEKVFDFRIQQLDERLKQNLEEIRSLLKQKMDIETNNNENKKLNDCLIDIKQEIDSFKKTNELIETKINEKLTEKESSIRKFYECTACNCKNSNQQIAVATSTANSTSKPFKKQKSRHFDNNYENLDEQNELSSTVDTPTDNLNGNYMFSDSESIVSKIQIECDKYLSTNLTNFLEKTKYFTNIENQLNKEIKSFKNDIQDMKLFVEQKTQEQSTKISILEDNIRNSNYKNNEKRIFNNLEELNSNLQKLLTEKINLTQKDLNKIKSEYNKQKVEIDNLKKLLGKYEKLYCDEQLIEEEDFSENQNEKYKTKINDKNENSKLKVKKETNEVNQKLSSIKDKKNNKNNNGSTDNSKNSKVSELKNTTNESAINPIKSRLRKPKEKKCPSDLYMDDFDKFTNDFNNSQILKTIKDELKFKEKKNKHKNDLAKVKKTNKKETIKNKNSKVKKNFKEIEKTQSSKDFKDAKKTEENNDIDGNVLLPSINESEKKIVKSSKNKSCIEEEKLDDKLEKNSELISSKENLNKKEDKNELIGNDSEKINQEKNLKQIETEDPIKENKEKKTKDPTDLLAKIVNEVLFTEPDQNASTTSTFNPQFTFTQQPSTAILRPFFDPTGLGLNSNKFLVSLTRTINQPNVSAPQMLLVNSTLKQSQTSICNNVMTTSTPTFISTNTTNISNTNLLESLKTKIKNNTAQPSAKIDEIVQKNSSITSTTLELQKKNVSKLDNSEELIIKDKNAKKELNKKKNNKTQTCSSILNKKRSSSRISFKQNEKTIDFNKQLKEKVEPVKNTKKRESVTTDEIDDNNIDFKEESISKRKRRKTNEVLTKSFEEIQATFLNDPKLANIKLTTGQSKKNYKNKVGQSILLDSPSSTTSKISLKKKNNSKLDIDFADDKKNKNYSNEYDSATDCEEEDAQVKKKYITGKAKNKNVKDKKLLDTVSNNLKKLVEKKQASCSLERVTSSTNEIPDCPITTSNDYKSQEISSSTSDKNDNKKKKKKLNDYVKRRRPKSLVNEKKKEAKNDNGLANFDDIIMDTIDNVVLKSFDEKNNEIATGSDKLKKDSLNKEKNFFKKENKLKKTKITEKLRKKVNKNSVLNQTSLEVEKNKKAEKNIIKSLKKSVKEIDLSKQKKVLKSTSVKANKDKNSSFELADSPSKIISVNLSNNTKKNQTKNNSICDNIISTSSSFGSDNKVVSNDFKNSTENEELIIKEIVYKLVDSVVHNK